MTEEQKQFDNMDILYFDALYFITTTMTSVGYGEFSAFNTGTMSMTMIVCTQFFGLLGFAIIKDQVFNVHNVRDIQDIVKQVREDVEDTLYRIDRLKDADLPVVMYE